MNRTHCLGRCLLLGLALVGAWTPAAVIATPGAQASASEPAGVEALPVSDEAEEPVRPELRIV